MDRREFFTSTGRATALAVGASFGLSASPILGQQKKPAQPAVGPLRVSPDNPRYFCDTSGREVLLVGSHTWNNLVDMGTVQMNVEIRDVTNNITYDCQTAISHGEAACIGNEIRVTITDLDFPLTMPFLGTFLHSVYHSPLLHPHDPPLPQEGSF